MIQKNDKLLGKIYNFEKNAWSLEKRHVLSNN